MARRYWTPQSLSFRQWKAPPQVADIHTKPEDLPAVIEKALADIDGPVWPYPVAQQIPIDAVVEQEQVG